MLSENKREESRKKPRLPEYDYSQNGAYFVTICTQGRKKYFGHIVGAGHPAGPHVELSAYGNIVDEHIRAVDSAYQNVTIDYYIIMPDHIHLMVRIKTDDGPARCPAPTASLPKVIGALKSLCSRAAKIPLWQRSYYEHVIRCENDYLECAQYILNNPIAWVERHGLSD